MDPHAELREQWDAISGGWLRWQDTYERGGAAVTAKLMELAGIRRGQRVLDVGTGLGEPALTVARAVGPHGWVVGIDVSGEMVKLARERAAGAANVDFVEAAPETFEGQRFDAILSRWCLMLAPDRVATLRALRDLLVPGGVLAAAVWGRPGTAPMVSLAFPVLSERLELPPPPPGQPGPYAMADPDQCRAELQAAGFTGVSVVEQPAPFWLSEPAEYARYARDVLPDRFQRMLRAKFGSADDPETWAAVTRLAAGHLAPDGRVDLTSTALCLRGTA